MLALLAGCAAAVDPAAQGPRRLRHSGGGPAASSSSPQTSAAPEEAPSDKEAQRDAVLTAWALWASGDVAAARAALGAVALEPESGAALGALRGFVARGAKEHALSFTGSAADGAVFFDPASGAPKSFRSGMPSLPPLLAGRPALVAPYFAAEAALLDASSGTLVELPGPLVAVHPDGARVFVLDTSPDKVTGNARCVLIEWSLLTRAPLRDLPTPPEPDAIGCDAYGYRDAAVTPNGAWLTTRLGRVSLRGGGVVPLPRASKEGYQPTVSPDGRALVRVVSIPHADPAATANVTRLAATDLDTGVTRFSRERLSFLSNSDPLSTLVDPPRICVFDYGVYAFAWPSLEAIHADDESARVTLHTGCRDRGAHLSELPEANAVLAQLCLRGGFVLPRALCE